MDFFVETPKYIELLLQIAGVLAIVLGGIFVFLNYFDKVKKDRQKEADALDEKIISRLKEDVRLQGESITLLQTEVKQVREENIKLATENKTLTKILQGRDENSEALQLEAFKAIKQVETIHEAVVTITSQNSRTNHNIETLNKSIESLIKKMPALAT